MKHVVAFDIGGTKVEGVLFDENFSRIRENRKYFEKKAGQIEVGISRNEFLEMIEGMIRSLGEGREINGIGISIPDVVNQNGKIVGGSKIKSLGDFDIGEYFSNKFGIKTVVKNDGDCFALAEQRMGAGKGMENVVGVVWGTGIGSGIIIEGKLYEAARGSTGEFGHNTIDPNGPLCRCGLRGCVEAFVGGQNLARNYLAEGGNIEGENPSEIFEMQDSFSLEFVSGALDAFSRGLAQLQNILNPQMIVMGGGLSELDVYRPLTELTKKYSKDGVRNNVKIVKNLLGGSAGTYGVAILVFEQLG